MKERSKNMKKKKKKKSVINRTFVVGKSSITITKKCIKIKTPKLVIVQ